MEQIIEILNFKFCLIFFILQFLIIYLTRLRAKRFKNLDIKLIKNKNQITIWEVQAYLSFSRWVSFVLPFKIGEIVSFYLLKKKIIKIFSSLLSYTLGCKLFEILFLLLISSYICFIFFLETQFSNYNIIFIRLSYIALIVITLLIFFILKRNKKKILKINFKNNYINDSKLLINSKYFFSYTIHISSVQFVSTILLLFICSDQSIDNELFFLSTAYILLNLIPLRLPLNIGVFDVFASVGEYFYSYGLSFENLIIFRGVQLILYSVDFIFWYIFFSFKKN
jgi:hypothetical protein